MKKKIIYYLISFIFVIICLNNNFINIFEMLPEKTNLIFNDVFVETCKATLTVKDTGKVYDDLEIILIYRQIPNNFIFLEKYSTNLVEQAFFNFLNDRCVFHMNGYWMSGERSFFQFNFISYNFKPIDFTFIITYQDNDKLSLHTIDNIFPIMQNYDNIYFELKGPFKRWSCQLTNSTSDLESVINFYNSSNKILKTSFIMPIDKSSAQILVLIDDPIKGTFNYSKIFGGWNKNGQE